MKAKRLYLLFTLISSLGLTACGLNDVDRTLRQIDSNPNAQQQDPNTAASFVRSLQGPQDPIVASGSSLRCSVELESSASYSLVLLKFVSLNPATDEVYEVLSENILDYPNEQEAQYIATAPDIGKDIGCQLEFETSSEAEYAMLADEFSSIEASTDYDLMVQSLKINSTKPIVGGNLSCELSLSSVFPLEDIQSIRLNMVHIDSTDSEVQVERILASKGFYFGQTAMTEDDRVLQFSARPTREFTKKRVYCFAVITHSNDSELVMSFSNESYKIFAKNSCVLRSAVSMGSSTYSRAGLPQLGSNQLTPVNVEKVKLKKCHSALEMAPDRP